MSLETLKPMLDEYTNRVLAMGKCKIFYHITVSNLGQVEKIGGSKSKGLN